MIDIKKNEELSEVKKDVEWYKISDVDIFERLDVDVNKGLSQHEAEARLKVYGENTLPESKKTKWFIFFGKSFLNPLSLVMLFAGLISIIVPLIIGKLEPPDVIGIIIIGTIILINSIIATVQEVKSQKYVSSLGSTEEYTVFCLRNSKKKQINVKQLVPGDIVFMTSGNFVPADIRIINNQMLRIDESSLTGENEPVLKTSDSILQENLMLGDQKNIAFMSTLILEGKMMGIVFATGINSEIGKIASNITNTKKEKSILEKNVTKLTAIIGVTAIIFGSILFGCSFLLRSDFHENLRNWYKLLSIAVSAALAIIPESLIIIVKISLMIAIKKMARKNVIFKSSSAIETLGSVNIICTDKTGTLTQNKMSVSKVFINFKSQDLELINYEKNKEFLNCLALCSDAIIAKEKIGSPTELALINFVLSQKINYLMLRKKYQRIDEVPFDSKRKLMSSVNLVDKKSTVFMKGAWEYIFKKCKSKLVDGKTTVLSPNDITTIENQLIDFAKKGYRVLAFATKTIDNNKKNYEDNLTFLGAVAIIDPPREGVYEAIQIAKNAGVRTVMITGDHKITAFEIARQLNIVDENHDQVITGEQIEQLNRMELNELLKSTNVFARVNPNHKAIIVDAFKAQDYTVAMTGDGVNDSPSLVKANVGIAMGIAGSEVTKEVCDVVLKDDNFKSIVTGVSSGRNVYEKIKYSISFLLAVNLSQILTIFLVLLCYKDLALNAVGILVHILIVETIVAIPIGLSRERKGVMRNILTNKKKQSLLKDIIVQITVTTFFNVLFSVLSYQTALWYVHWDSNLAAMYGKTGVYIVMIFAPIFYVILYNNACLPIRYAPKTERIDKYKPNIYLWCLMVLAAVLGIITLLPFGAINVFFEFQIKDMPVSLLFIFIFLAIVPTFLIYLTYNFILWINFKVKNLKIRAL